MEYVNAGARISGARPKTKKALREALQTAPETVTFDPTSLHHEFGPPITGDAIPEHVSLSVCGPDPYTSRRWYTQVTASPDGPLMT